MVLGGEVGVRGGRSDTGALGCTSDGRAFVPARRASSAAASMRRSTSSSCFGVSLRRVFSAAGSETLLVESAPLSEMACDRHVVACDSGYVRCAVAHRGEGERCRGRPRGYAGYVRLGKSLGVVIDHDLPATMRNAIRRDARWPVDRSDTSIRVDGLSGVVERAVLDVVAHSR